MNTLELTTEQKRYIYDRQSGMCAFTGKKFEEFTDSMAVEFVAVNTDTTNNDNIVMIWVQHKSIPKTDLRKYHFPHANFSGYDSTHMADEFKVDVEEVVSLSSTSTDKRQIRNRIRDLTNYLSTIGIGKSLKDEFRGLLKSANENLTQRENEIKEKDKIVWKENYDVIKKKVDDAIEFAKNTAIFKEGREKLSEVNKELRGLKLSQTDKNDLEFLINNEIREINEKYQNWAENHEFEIIENYYSLRSSIEDAIHRAFSFETFLEARDTLIVVQNQIREKVLRKVQRDELFGSIHNAFDELREKFTEYKRITDEEAKENYDIVKQQVDSAIEFAKSVSIDEVNNAREKFIQAQQVIKEARLKREQKDELFSTIREVFTTINEMSSEEQKKFDTEAENNHKDLLSKIEVAIVEIENALDFRQSADDLAGISTDLKLAKLKRNQRGKLYDKMRLAYDLLYKKRDEYDKYRFTEKKKRLVDTLEGMKQRNDRTIKLLSKDKELLTKQQEKLSATTEDNTILKDRNQQVIKEIEVRIKEKETSISNVEKRILSIEKEIERTEKLEENIKIRREKRNESREERNAKNTKMEAVKEENNSAVQINETPKQDSDIIKQNDEVEQDNSVNETTNENVQSEATE